jgi:hypothetical protein
MIYVLILAVAVFLLVFIDRPIWNLSFKDGVLISHKGEIPHGFLKESQLIAKRTPFSGSVKVYKNRFKTKMVTSKSVPNKVKQQLHQHLPHTSK